MCICVNEYMYFGVCLWVALLVSTRNFVVRQHCLSTLIIIIIVNLYNQALAMKLISAHSFWPECQNASWQLSFDFLSRKICATHIRHANAIYILIVYRRIVSGCRWESETMGRINIDDGLINSPLQHIRNILTTCRPRAFVRGHKFISDKFATHSRHLYGNLIACCCLLPIPVQLVGTG